MRGWIDSTCRPLVDNSKAFLLLIAIVLLFTVRARPNFCSVDGKDLENGRTP